MPVNQKAYANKGSSSTVAGTNYSVAGTLAWFVVVGVSYVVLLMILAGPHFFGHHIKVGDTVEQEITAPKRSLIVDEDKTQDLRECARHSVMPVLKRDEKKSAAILSAVLSQLEKLKQMQAQGILPLDEPPVFSADEQVFLIELPDHEFEKFCAAAKTPSGNSPIPGDLAESVLAKLRSLPQTAPPAKRGKTAAPVLLQADYIAKLTKGREQYQKLKGTRSNIEHKILCVAAMLEPEDLKQYSADVSSSVKRLLAHVKLEPYAERNEWELQVFEFLPDRIQDNLRHATADLVSSQFEPNVSADPTATDREMKVALAAVKPVMKEIEVGTVIVPKGKILDASDVKTLETVGITQISDPGLAAVIAIALFAAFLLFGVYLYTYEPKLFFSPSAIALMATVSIITCTLALFIGPQYPQFVPLSATTLILAVTYKRRLTGILAALILLFLSVSELVTGAHLVALGCASGMALGASVKRRRDLMLTGILVGVMQAVGYTLAIVVSGAPTQNANLTTVLPMEMLGGLFSSIAAIGSLPFLENIFGILTPYRIAELAEPDQPLMRQLEENAPGTYQHSLAVANLAEGGARAIGCDVNLVHTGAMYHDIGKMVTPRYFIENQLGDKNPHDFIPPEESSAKVLAHVTNGIALAQKYGLPKAIQAFIPEHQGTTIMAYFYHKACLRDGAENVDPMFYRYPGPKPQTKESAIVMLADVSEAVTHSMHDPSMEEVEAAMSNVFKARWDDGQFSESGLSSEELERVKRGFVRVWRTLHHERLKYPATTTGKMPVVPASTTAAADAGKNGESNSAGIDVGPDTHCCASEWDC